jgi:RimJ/RimL family protein N-acetyltransferase
MQIARLKPQHAPAYRALMLAAYTLHPSAFTSSAAERERMPLSWWEQRLDDSPWADAVVLGAFDRDTLAGAAGVRFEASEKLRHKATLFGMYVAARQRGKGLGLSLVQAALQLAREVPQVRLIQLTVTEGNAAAMALYQRCGFVAFGIEPDAVAVGQGFVGKVHMWRRLALPGAASGD